MSAVNAVSNPPVLELDDEARSPGETGHLVNHGGKVLSHVDVENVYLGSYWSTSAGKKDRTHNDDAMAAFVKDPGMNGVWKEYGAGPGTTTPSVQLQTTAKQLTQDQLEQLLKEQIASGKLDTSDPQRVFSFVLPPGCELVSSHGETSHDGVGGFHGSITDKGKEVYYAAIVYSKGDNGIAFSPKPMDNVSIAESHEITEAATDPDVELAARTGESSKLGWYDDVTHWSHFGIPRVGKGEIGDIPMLNAELKGNGLKDAWGRVDGFAFQKEWSNKDDQAELAPKKP
jgi:hypothetical protein